MKMTVKKFLTNLAMTLAAAALLVGVCYGILANGKAAEAGSMKKYNSLAGVQPVPELDKVEATWTRPGKGTVGDVEWTQIKIGDDEYKIPDLFNHELVINFSRGFIEYRGAHIFLNVKDYLDAGVKWRTAVNAAAVFMVRVIDHYEDCESDWYYKKMVWMRYPSAYTYRRWQRGEGELRLLGESGSY